jgi:hypothetical protein
LKNYGFEEYDTSGKCLVRKIYNDEDGMVNRVKVDTWLVLLVPVVLKDELMVGLSVSWPGFAKNG